MKCLFRFTHPRAVHVSLLGEFNRWSTTATPMCRSEDGVWEASVELPAGRHRYCYFVIDAEGASGGVGTGDYTAPWDLQRRRLTGDGDESYLARIGIVNLGSELCVPTDGCMPPERLELLN